MNNKWKNACSNWKVAKNYVMRDLEIISEILNIDIVNVSEKCMKLNTVFNYII